MIAMLLTSAFAFAGLYGVLVIAAAWLRHGQAALALRGELARCPEMRSFTYRIVQHELAKRPSGRVIAFPVKVGTTRAAGQPLRAAA
jgi:hypothetical protein